MPRFGQQLRDWLHQRLKQETDRDCSVIYSHVGKSRLASRADPGLKSVSSVSSAPDDEGPPHGET